MVTSRFHNNTSVIILTPNRSASWRDTQWLLALVSIPVAIIALGWSFSGAWLVLPFAGLELALLGTLMYRVSWNTYQRQLIKINRNSVFIESGYRQKKRIFLGRTSTYVQFVETDQDWELPVITLVCPATRVEVGQFLNLNDRKQLKLDLEKAGLIVCRSHWWKQ